MKNLLVCLVLAFCLLFLTPKLKAQSGERNLLLSGATLAQAEQELGKVLQNLADASQVELTLKTKQPDQQVAPNLAKVSIQLESNCNLDRLIRFLDRIKSYEKLLRVEELFITSFRIQGRSEIRPSLKISAFVENTGDNVREQAGELLSQRDQNLEVLGEFIGLLPPDAVLTTYRNRDCAIQISGLFPPSSSYDLMAKLEKSPFLKDVISEGTIYVDSSTGKERAIFSAKCEK